MTVHHHRWHTLSTHDTSEGRVSYQSCACGRWQIVLSASTPIASL
jgi:hypothetical protein